MRKKYNCYSVLERCGDKNMNYYITAPNDRIAMEFAYKETRGQILEFIRVNLEIFSLDYSEPDNEDNTEWRVIGETVNI